MDALDKQILAIIQSGFPIASRPYAVIGEQVGISEDEALSRVAKLREDGVIRRIGANFGSRELGWESTLCAAKVPEEKIEEFVAEVNKHKGVTHNYLRENKFNIWFTYIGPDWDNVVNTLQSITDKTGIDILNLPASFLFKIKVDFNMDDDSKEKD
ncbi:DNA-binding transcriptional regulator, Lrp family [Maridesulfovibrio ferrireducens]|uniref:siroheme decarboxylase n=1 Tax=Maridesulfovibrio ferrireducens TaxID=246191 RepID=A0A1G9F3L2_9BACT|nr:AsnC family transcriptional regulator [Maridesulfovibrio ferrireducens]SDK83049.1 DNA-binding transcriptional regulator, Lrp family [Maridesulfovibrio ferrireducens]